MKDVRKDIIFRDTDYKEKFRIKDGESIKVTRGYDGEVVLRKCRFIDEAHVKVGNDYFHIDEYAEKSARAGNETEPIRPEWQKETAAKLAERAERIRKGDVDPLIDNMLRVTNDGRKLNLEPKIDILAAKYGEALRETEIPMTEAALRELVGGDYTTETLYYPNQTNQFKDRTVEIQGKVYGAVIRGKDGVAVCGLTDGVLTSLHPYNAQTCKRELSPAMRAGEDKPIPAHKHRNRDDAR
jgi:hypothetical protein